MLPHPILSTWAIRTPCYTGHMDAFLPPALGWGHLSSLLHWACGHFLSSSCCIRHMGTSPHHGCTMRGWVQLPQPYLQLSEHWLLCCTTPRCAVPHAMTFSAPQGRAGSTGQRGSPQFLAAVAATRAMGRAAVG